MLGKPPPAAIVHDTGTMQAEEGARMEAAQKRRLNAGVASSQHERAARTS